MLNDALYLAIAANGGGGGGGSSDFELVGTTSTYRGDDYLSDEDRELLLLTIDHTETYCCFITCVCGTDVYKLPLSQNGAFPDSVTTGNGNFIARNGGANATDMYNFTVQIIRSSKKFNTAVIKLKSSTGTPVDSFYFKVYKML